MTLKRETIVLRCQNINADPSKLHLSARAATASTFTAASYVARTQASAAPVATVSLLAS